MMQWTHTQRCSERQAVADIDERWTVTPLDASMWPQPAPEGMSGALLASQQTSDVS
jgi:hypothetical protein